MPVLEVSQLEVTRGARAVVQGVSFAVERGESVTIMGASGSGKTSVLRAIAGLDPIAAGGIDIDGVAIRPGRTPGRSRATRAVSTGWEWCSSFTTCSSTSRRFTTSGWLRCMCSHQPRKAAERRALELLEQMGIACARARDASRVIRRRSATCRDRSCAGDGTAGAADG